MSPLEYAIPCTMMSPLESANPYTVMSTLRVCYSVHTDVVPKVCYSVHNDVNLRVSYSVHNDVNPRDCYSIQNDFTPRVYYSAHKGITLRACYSMHNDVTPRVLFGQQKSIFVRNLPRLDKIPWRVYSIFVIINNLDNLWLIINMGGAMSIYRKDQHICHRSHIPWIYSLAPNAKFRLKFMVEKSTSWELYEVGLVFSSCRLPFNTQ